MARVWLVFLLGALAPTIGFSQFVPPPEGGLGPGGFGTPGEEPPMPPTIPDLPWAIGEVTSPITYSEAYEGVGGLHIFEVPIEVAPGTDSGFWYSVDVIDIEAVGDVADFETLGEYFRQWEGTAGFYTQEVLDSLLNFPVGTDSLSVLFAGNEVGTFDANFKFTFNDGTVVDTMFTANITETDSGGLPPVDCSGIERRPLPENGFLVAEEGCVELISIPTEVGNGLMAAKLVARGVDPEATLVTFTNLSISNAHQVSAGGDAQTVGGTVFGKPEAGRTYHEDWIPLDSHLLISEEAIGGGVGLGGINETNDGASPVGNSLPELFGFKPVTGHGTISMRNASDAFFLLPEHQSNILDVAYIVSDGSEPVELTLGILGTGIRDAGTENGAAFGYGDGVARISVPFSSQAVPEPSGQGLAMLAGAHRRNGHSRRCGIAAGHVRRRNR